MPAGQPPLDIAVRVRNWFWYWNVKEITGLSDDGLDARFAKDKEGKARMRAFYRIRSIGSSPLDTRGHRKSESVFNAVHVCDRDACLFKPAWADYRSGVWKMLTKRALAPRWVRACMSSVARRKGLTCITPHDTALLMELVEDDQLLHAIGFDIPRQPLLRTLAEQGDLDSLTFLSGLYLQLVAARQLSMAIMVGREVSLCAMHVGVRMNVPQELALLLERLVEDRILHDIWLTEADFKAASIKSGERRALTQARRRRQVQDLVLWHLSKTHQAGHLAPVGMPAVDSAALRWTQDHRDALLALRQELRNNAHQRRAYGDCPLPAWRDPASRLDARARELRAELTGSLRAMVEAKPGDSVPIANGDC